ncbi:MAG TPA: penicillin-binding transpeptidase domain-containing protein [Bryobacteraceae bacterium]|nr:penicillin-binding transpeptidase domain-containing protein [Bryobacteraceae bacterium]
MPGFLLSRRAVLGGLLAGVAQNPSREALVLLDVRTRRVLAATGGERARRWLAPPGSTVKPFAISALLEAGKLRKDEAFPCPGKLILAGRSFACSHPPIGVPIQPSTAIAYSCNCFVAHFAQRFEPGELARFFTRMQFTSDTGKIEPAITAEDRQLQALGESRVLVTPFGLASLYARLAAVARPEVLEGLEGAVEYGTAQLARIPEVRLAGKTGSAVIQQNQRVAWFAGFAPSRSPEIAVAVAVPGYSGGSDAAPIAGRILQTHFARKS